MGFAIGITGATGVTGVTGEVTLRVLQERAFPVGELRLFASRRSAGRTIRWKGRDHPVEALEDARFASLDLVISATSAAIAREWAPRMVGAPRAAKFYQVERQLNRIIRAKIASLVPLAKPK